MKIFIDADACPCKEETIKTAKELNIPVCMVIDTSHVLKNDYAEIITVDKDRDSADFAILNLMDKGDLVVTNDYGLASMVLGKAGYAISYFGMEYTSFNIDKLLFERHLNQKIRQSGGRHKSSPKRSKEDNITFENGLKLLLQKIR